MTTMFALMTRRSQSPMSHLHPYRMRLYRTRKDAHIARGLARIWAQKAGREIPVFTVVPVEIPEV